MQPFDDASTDDVLPKIPAVVEIAANSASFTAIAMPAGMTPQAVRYHLHIEPVSVAYELRFGSETTGVRVLANTAFSLPYPIPRTVLAQVKLASGDLTVRCFVAWPDR